MPPTSRHAARPPAPATSTAPAGGAAHLPRFHLPAFHLPVVRPIAVLLLTSLLVSGGCRREAEPKPSLPPPVARWLEAAYHEADGTRRERLQRWSGPLALSATGAVGPDDLARLRGVAARLEIAAPRLRPSLEYEPTAFVVRYLPPPAAEGTEGAEGTAGGPESRGERGPEPRVETDCPPDAAGRIQRAEVRVPTGEWIPQSLRDDLALEGLVTCLGLPGRLAPGVLDGEYESVLAAEPNWGDVRLTDADLSTLSVHFDPALAPGLTAPEALAALGLEAPPPGP